MKYLKISIEYVINFILVHLIIGPIYLNSTFGKTTPDEKFFHLLIPVGGVNKDVFISYFLKGILSITGCSLPIYNITGSTLPDIADTVCSKEKKCPPGLPAFEKMEYTIFILKFVVQLED